MSNYILFFLNNKNITRVLNECVIYLNFFYKVSKHIIIIMYKLLFKIRVCEWYFIQK